MMHLNALRLRLSNEKIRIARIVGVKEREIRSVWVMQIEKEIKAELKFLGLPETQKEIEPLSDAELLAALKS